MEKQGHTLILPEMRKVASPIGKSDRQAEQFQANAEQSRRSAASPFLLDSLKWQGLDSSFRLRYLPSIYDARPPPHSAEFRFRAGAQTFGHPAHGHGSLDRGRRGGSRRDGHHGVAGRDGGRRS